MPMKVSHFLGVTVREGDEERQYTMPEDRDEGYATRDEALAARRALIQQGIANRDIAYIAYHEEVD
jgi:hypothetical protein